MGCSSSKKQHNGRTNRDFNEKIKEDLHVHFPDEQTFLNLKSIPTVVIQEIYTFSKKIAGQGSFGTVRVVSLKTDSNLIFALKSIPKEKIKRALLLLNREIEIMKKIDHPNIVKLFRVYQDFKYYYLLLEYCSGGELLDRIIHFRFGFTETMAIEIIKPMLYAIKYLHENGVCHRDLKPENFMFKDETENSDLKLIDFGLAYNLMIGDHNTMKSVAGSAFYIAPEVHSGKYNNACDIWSLGVISYLLLFGELPIKGNNHVEILKSFETFSAKAQVMPAIHLSGEAKLFLISTLEKDPKKRLKSKDALNHKWFSVSLRKSISNSEEKFEILNKIQNFRSIQKFKKEAMKIVLSMLKADELQKLKEVFLEFDNDHSGRINIQNVENALEQIGMENTSREIDQLKEHLQLNKENEINYSDFISAILDQKYLTNERISAAFKFFDVDNSGFISLENIKDAMKRAGRDINEDEVNGMLDELDLMNNGQISFDEFAFVLKSNEFVKISSDEFLRRCSKESSQIIKQNC